MILAGQGTDVIKLEIPQNGDYTRASANRRGVCAWLSGIVGHYRPEDVVSPGTWCSSSANAAAIKARV